MFYYDVRSVLAVAYAATGQQARAAELCHETLELVRAVVSLRDLNLVHMHWIWCESLPSASRRTRAQGSRPMPHRSKHAKPTRQPPCSRARPVAAVAAAERSR